MTASQLRKSSGRGSQQTLSRPSQKRGAASRVLWDTPNVPARVMTRGARLFVTRWLMPQRQDLALHGGTAAKGKEEKSEKGTSGRDQGGGHHPRSQRLVLHGAHSADDVRGPPRTRARQPQALRVFTRDSPSLSCQLTLARWQRPSRRRWASSCRTSLTPRTPMLWASSLSTTRTRTTGISPASRRRRWRGRKPEVWWRSRAGSVGQVA